MCKLSSRLIQQHHLDEMLFVVSMLAAQQHGMFNACFACHGGMFVLACRIEPSNAKDLTPFQDVRLGPLVGKGSFGKVYRGIRNNKIVAIKVSAVVSMLVWQQPQYAMAT